MEMLNLLYQQSLINESKYFKNKTFANLLL